MRILAALTLLISALLSPLTTAAPLEMRWEFEVNPNQFMRRSILIDMGRIYATQSGGCAVRLRLQSQDDPSSEGYVLLIVGENGATKWHSEVIEGGYWLWTTHNNAAYIDTGRGLEFMVDLDSGLETQLPTGTSVNGRGGNDAQYNWSSSFLFLRKNIEEQRAIQKWAPASPTPNLAPSTFGLEDGNLILSWPTAGGQTYQVQRSTDLESWENIGVALTGNGTTMSYAQPSTADKVFLRVVIP